MKGEKEGGEGRVSTHLAAGIATMVSLFATSDGAARTIDFDDTLERLLESSKCPESLEKLPVAISGMAGAMKGWRDAGYVPTPATLEAVAHGGVAFSSKRGREVCIFGGAKDSASGDVMRGEEVQIIGCSVSKGIVVLPGTHTKWVEIGEGGAIQSLKTFMTGEVFGLLHHHSLLSQTTSTSTHTEKGGGGEGGGGGEMEELDEEAFMEGVRRGATPSAGFLGAIFETRSRVLAATLSAGGSARSFLSGVCLGVEMHAATHNSPTSFRLIGSLSQFHRYDLAAKALKLPPPIHLVPPPEAQESAAVAGITRLLHTLSSPSPSSSLPAPSSTPHPLPSTDDILRRELERSMEAVEVGKCVAILRGLGPRVAVGVAEALVEAGVRVIEVPLNRPGALESISILATHFASNPRIVIGAGTVLTVEQVEKVQEAGGTVVVMPNTNVEVIRACLARGMVPIPGIQTPTEAFAAIEAGAEMLKLFPARVLGIKGMKDLRAVLPTHIRMIPVGGVGAENAAQWMSAGAAALGVGSALFKPEWSSEEVEEAARALYRAMHSE